MGQEEEALPPAAAAFSLEHDQDVEARGMPGSPRNATVFLSRELDPPAKPAVKPRGVPGSLRKAPAAPTRRLSPVPPPPGWPAARGLSRAVRPEDDPFLAAYLACTKSTGDGGKKRTPGAREPGKGQRQFAWGLGRLSCKRDDGAVVQSVLRVAKRPEVDSRDARLI